MAQILIISDPKAWDALRGLWSREPGVQIACAASAGQARRDHLSCPPDLVLVNAPLSDEFGRDVALQFLDKGCDVLMLVAAPQADKMAAALEKHGVFVAAKPLTRQSAAFALRFVRTAHARTAKLMEHNRRLSKRLDEMRLISRAKCALVRYCDMTEDQAHRAVEQRAMDARISLKDAALSILKTYEAIE